MKRLHRPNGPTVPVLHACAARVRVEAGAVVCDEQHGAIAVIGDVGGYRLATAAPWMQRLPAVYELRSGTLVTLRRELPLARMASRSFS